MGKQHRVLVDGVENLVDEILGPQTLTHRQILEARAMQAIVSGMYAVGDGGLYADDCVLAYEGEIKKPRSEMRASQLADIRKDACDIAAAMLASDEEKTTD